MSVVITEGYNGMANNEELTGTTEYLTPQARCRINRCRYNGIRVYLSVGCFTAPVVVQTGRAVSNGRIREQ
jgi:hypothetical protein